jgi:hypothetical protein
MSDFLFANPTFLYGLARALDLAGEFDIYNASPTPELADWIALHADMAAVGKDFWVAFNECEECSPLTGLPRL